MPENSIIDLMKLLPLLLCAAALLYAQSTQPAQPVSEPVFASTAEITLVTRQFAQIEPRLLDIVHQSGGQIVEMSNDRERSSLTITLLLAKPAFDSLARQLPALATVARNTVRTTDLSDNLRDVQTELDWTLANLSDTTLSDSLQRAYRETIHSLEVRKQDLRAKAAWHRLTVSLSEDNPFQYSYDTDSWFSFINMPGIEVRHLRLESPAGGRTLEAYQGLALRYMFTQGKSYVHLGVLKPTDSNPSDTAITDIFFYDWGTDFYPRHLGKGKRKFLNLYSGFTIGGMLLGSDADYDHTFTLGAHIGLELLKLQYFIWDVHGGYLFPLDTEWNRKLRGIDAGSALNFVF